MSRHFLTNTEKIMIGLCCVNCGTDKNVGYHHIVPLECGGNDIMSNMVCLCEDCHSLIHYGKRGVIDHGCLIKKGIKRALKEGKRIGKPPADYERIMRLAAEKSTMFNLNSDWTEAEIMREAKCSYTTYCKCKKMLIQIMDGGKWPFGWERPTRVRNMPKYAGQIVKERWKREADQK